MTKATPPSASSTCISMSELLDGESGNEYRHTNY
jgi:hypothetical protein